MTDGFEGGTEGCCKSPLAGWISVARITDKSQPHPILLRVSLPFIFNVIGPWSTGMTLGTMYWHDLTAELEVDVQPLTTVTPGRSGR